MILTVKYFDADRVKVRSENAVTLRIYETCVKNTENSKVQARSAVPTIVQPWSRASPGAPETIPKHGVEQDGSSIKPAAKEFRSMSDISSVVPNGSGSAVPVNRVFGASAAGPALRPASVVEVMPSRSEAMATDRVELSNFARYLDQLRRLPDARIDRVTQVRQAIAEGTYETPDKIDLVIDRRAEDELL